MCIVSYLRNSAKTFAVELEPALGPQLVEIITRAGTDAYGDVVKQLEKILGLDLNLEKEADKISSTWSIMWERNRWYWWECAWHTAGTVRTGYLVRLSLA